MASFCKDSFLRAILDPSGDQSTHRLALMHLGAELLELDLLLKNESDLKKPFDGNHPTETDRTEP